MTDTGARRSTSNGNSTGSSYTRRRRRQWLVDTYGDGTTCVCSFEGCEAVLTVDNVSVDRYPIPGIEGGTYRRDNIRPSCLPCNTKHGSALGVARKKEIARGRAQQSGA